MRYYEANLCGCGGGAGHLLSNISDRWDMFHSKVFVWGVCYGVAQQCNGTIDATCQGEKSCFSGTGSCQTVSTYCDSGLGPVYYLQFFEVTHPYCDTSVSGKCTFSYQHCKGKRRYLNGMCQNLLCTNYDDVCGC